MVQRVLFKGHEQKEFLNLAIANLSCLSLRGLLQFGFKVNYSSLKNYYSERRALPRDLFESVLELAKINRNRFRVNFLDENWGQVKGGKASKRK